jgi:hypothetical protein
VLNDTANEMALAAIFAVAAKAAPIAYKHTLKPIVKEVSLQAGDKIGVIVDIVNPNRINIDNWLRREAENAQKQAVINALEKRKFARKYALDWYKKNLQGKTFNNSKFDISGVYNHKAGSKIANAGDLDLLSYANKIINKAQTAKSAINDGHALNTKGYEGFTKLTTPVNYNGRNMEAVSVLGKLKYVEQIKKSEPTSRINPSVLGSGNNNIINNKNLSSDFRIYDIYPRAYEGIKNLYYNPHYAG